MLGGACGGGAIAATGCGAAGSAGADMTACCRLPVRGGGGPAGRATGGGGPCRVVGGASAGGCIALLPGGRPGGGARGGGIKGGAMADVETLIFCGGWRILCGDASAG